VEAREILKLAMAKEEAARDLYARTAAGAEDPAVKALLTDLAAQEGKHRELLGAVDPEKLDDFQPERARDLQIAEYLEPRPLSQDADLQQVLSYAIRREAEARDFYERMAGAVEDAELAGLFRSLATMELAHKADLEQLYETVFMHDN
jgi:rubrerythrin